MVSRLIPWGLAASGAVAAIILASLPGRPEEVGRWVQSSPTARLAATARHFVPRPAELPAAPEASRAREAAGELPASALPGRAIPEGGLPADAPAQTVLPLPPATAPAPPGDIQPVPDDEPTVDDMAGREAPAT
jgi:hypothetical protein